jgi:hypothetical protein
VPRLRVQRMRISAGGNAAKSQLVKYREYLIEARPIERADGWGTHVQVWRAIGGHVSMAQLTSTQIASTREEADRRCIDYAIREIERGLELR